MRLGPLFAALLLVGGGAATWVWLKQTPVAQEGAPRGGPGGRRSGGADEAVPVSVAAVRAENVPVYREGIGNVVAINSVVVRSQIDGRLMSVEFTEGQELKKGMVLARIDPTIYQAQYDQAVAKKAQDMATLANARLDLVRYDRLAQSNAGPKQQADQQRALVAQFEAQVRSDEAAIDNAKAVLGYTTIAAPIDGRAGLRLVDPGNIVHSGDAGGLVTVTQLAPIAITFTLPQRDMSAISAALKRGAAPVEVLESDGSAVLATGVLETIDNQIDVSTGTIKLKAIFPNTDLKLWPGQFVSARVVIDTMAGAKVVPTSAIRRGPAGAFVYLVGADSKAVVTPVKISLQDELRTVVTEGLEVGVNVVTVGFSRLSDGKVVEVSTPGGAPSAGADGQRGRDRANAPASGASTNPIADAAAAEPAAKAPGAKGEGAGGKRGDGQGKGRKRDGAGPPVDAGNPKAAGGGKQP